MAKTKKQPNPPLHVELSANARGALETVKTAKRWNNKTATEIAILQLAASITTEKP